MSGIHITQHTMTDHLPSFDDVGIALRLSRSIKLALLGACVLCMGALVNEYYRYNAAMQSTLKTQAYTIAEYLDDIFENAERIGLIVAHQIASAHTPDVKHVQEIIGRANEANNSLREYNFGWIDSNDTFVYDRNVGALKSGINLSHRPYLQKSKKTPWKLHVSQVVLNSANGLRKIPGGIGITDQRNHYIGTLCVGMLTMELQEKINNEKHIGHYRELGYTFVVLDKDLHVTVHSINQGIDVMSTFYRDAIGSWNLLVGNGGNLTHMKFFVNKGLYCFHKNKSHDYVIIVGLTYATFLQGLLQQIVWYLAFIIVLIGTVVWACFHTRATLLTHVSQSVKNLENYYNVLPWKYDTCKNTLLSPLEQHTFSLWDLLHTCLKLRELSILSKNMTICLTPSLQPTITGHVDLVHIIFMTVIDIFINNNDDGKTLNISMENVCTKSIDFVIMYFVDDGLSLDEADLLHFIKQENRDSHLWPTIGELRQHLRAYGGNLFLEPHHDGKKVVVHIPVTPVLQSRRDALGGPPYPKLH